MPSSVMRSIRISGQSVMLAIRATTGRFSLSTTALALIDSNLSEATCIATRPNPVLMPGGTSERLQLQSLSSNGEAVNTLTGILLGWEPHMRLQKAEIRRRIIDAAYGCF